MDKFYKTGLLILSINILFQACIKIEIIPPIGFETTAAADSIVFAVIGDYGKDGSAETNVATMIKGWSPDFIITTGDNNYVKGEYKTIKQNISRHYGDFIYNYDAPSEYRCNGKAFEEGINRFFPSPGNHDANNKNGLAPYLNYFTLPGEENYYKFIWGPVTFYSLDTETEDLELQKEWLFEELNNSYTLFNIVYFHHSPWTLGPLGNNESMQWDFYNHNVDVVFTGHDHIYARIEKNDEPGMYYIVNGLGGKSLYNCDSEALPSTMFDSFCYAEDYGAIKAAADDNCLKIKFYSISDIGNAIDSIKIYK